MNVEAILLDLDGTLVDTAPDLVGVLNALLADRDRPPVPFAIARNEVSNGALGLLRLGFPERLGDSDLEPLRLEFLDVYTQDVCVKSKLFDGFDSILAELRRISAPWGIVTNKPHAMTTPLLEALDLPHPPGCVVSGDRLPQRKPHPAPLLLCARKLGVAARRCVYVGDARRDIEAGRAAEGLGGGAQVAHAAMGDTQVAPGGGVAGRHVPSRRVGGVQRGEAVPGVTRGVGRATADRGERLLWGIGTSGHG